MGILTYRNLPETLGGSFLKNVYVVRLFLGGQIFLIFQKIWFAITAIRASPGSKSLQDSCSI